MYFWLTPEKRTEEAVREGTELSFPSSEKGSMVEIESFSVGERESWMQSNTQKIGNWNKRSKQ